MTNRSTPSPAAAGAALLGGVDGEGGVQVGEEEAATSIHQDVLRLDVAVDVVELDLEGGVRRWQESETFQTFFKLASTTRTFCRTCGRGGTPPGGGGVAWRGTES